MRVLGYLQNHYRVFTKSRGYLLKALTVIYKSMRVFIKACEGIIFNTKSIRVFTTSMRVLLLAAKACEGN